MKHILRAALIPALLILSNALLAQQPEQDCYYAKKILCVASYHEAIPYTGFGANDHEIPYSTETGANAPGGVSCLPIQNPFPGVSTAEQNSVWYYFIPNMTGSLRFTIIPDGTEDYDFVLYNLSNDPSFDPNIYPLTSCQAIYANNDAMEIACNAQGGAGLTTGINSDSVLAGNTRFVNTVTVNKGDIYVLCVNRFGGAGGFTIDFTASTPGIFDVKEPWGDSTAVNNVDQNMLCTEDSFIVVFDELVKCSTIQSTDFEIRNSSGTVVPILAQVKGRGCSATNLGTDTLVFVLSAPFPTRGIYTVHAAGNSVTDMCPIGNAINVGDTITTLNVACADFGTANDTVCAGAVVLFTDSSGAHPGYTFKWNFGDPASGANNTSTAQNPTHTYITAGTYTITQTVFNTKVPVDSSVTVPPFTLTVLSCPPPVADFTVNRDTICPGDSVMFTDLTTNTPSSWSWSFPGGSPSSDTLQNPTVFYNTPGTYDVTLTATNPNGSDTETKTAYITVLNCNVNFTSDKQLLCDSGFINFSDLSGSAQAWNWSFPGGLPASSVQQDPTIYYASGGMYDVTLVVTYPTGETDTLTQPGYITVDTCGGGVFFPTGFNPESTTNPFYKPTVSGQVNDFYMAIFNRWGEKLFDAVDPNPGWNGKNNDEFLMPGVYVIYATYTLMSDEGPQKLEYKGTISLVR